MGQKSRGLGERTWPKGCQGEVKKNPAETSLSRAGCAAKHSSVCITLQLSVIIPSTSVNLHGLHWHHHGPMFPSKQKQLDKSSERVFSGLVAHAQVAPNASHCKHDQLERSGDCGLRPEGIERNIRTRELT